MCGRVGWEGHQGSYTLDYKCRCSLSLFFVFFLVVAVGEGYLVVQVDSRGAASEHSGSSSGF